jgi:iron-sulfur cluster assembly protein
MITLTKKAAKQVCKKLKERKKGIGIKVGIKTSGCNGFSYILEYADDIPIGCNEYESEYVSIIIDKKHLPYISGLIIDFVREDLNEGFTYINPNEKNQCGCGESFNI